MRKGLGSSNPSLSASQSAIFAFSAASSKIVRSSACFLPPKGTGESQIRIDDPNGIGTTTVNGINDFGNIVGLAQESSSASSSQSNMATPYGNLHTGNFPAGEIRGWLK
jgi:hypothetical protein